MPLADQISAIHTLAAQGHDLQEIATATGLEMGDVESVLGAGVTMAALTSGGGVGGPVIRKFPFAFDTPTLLTGAPVYTPTVGDILLDAWLEIETAWDGTTPQFDAGRFLDGYTSGWFREAGQVPRLDFLTDLVSTPVSAADSAETLLDFGMLTGADMRPNGVPVTEGSTALLSQVALTTYLLMTAQGQDFFGHQLYRAEFALPRVVPAKFVTADPVLICVSSDARTDGADPGSTQGAAVLYLVTATPV